WASWQDHRAEPPRSPDERARAADGDGLAPPSLEEVEEAISQFQRQRRLTGPALDSAWPPFLETVDAYLSQAPERLALAPLVRARVAAEYEIDRELRREDGPPAELATVVGGLVLRIDRKVWAMRTLAAASTRLKGPSEEDGLAWPISHGVITSGYGNRRDPLQPLRVRFHAGIDLAAPPHEPVYAVAAGTVVKAGWGGSGGRVVRLKHADGSHTVYAHLALIMVEVDQDLGQGDVLGLLGDTGRTTGPHLHFAVFVDGRAVDPLERLRSVPMAFSDTTPGIVFGYGE
ncbi:MAG TPA: M23 family metallopeptidase, partial [Myxococcota bacterium]|nr:M23 family metallopeptidase [Myxococcota bacterium]